MEISDFGAESSSHVAQQSRRDKLRIQQRCSDNLDQHFQPSVVHNQVRNLVYQSATISNVFSTYENEEDEEELGGSSVQPHRLVAETGQDSSLPMSRPILSNFTSEPKTRGSSSHDPHGYDWMMTYGSADGAGEVISADAGAVNNGSYQDLHLQSVGFVNHFSEIPGNYRQKLFRDMQFGLHHLHHPIYHDSLPEAALQLDHIGNAWINRPAENSHQWSGDPTTQSLSLTLSSNPSSDVNATPFNDGYESEYLLPKSGGAALKEDTGVAKSSSYISPMEKPSIISRSTGKSVQDTVGSSPGANRSMGPLGPFTGYATILKSSRFMKPAQELLEELCNATCSEILRSNGDQGSVSTLADVSPASAENSGAGNYDSGMSCSSYSLNEGGNGDGKGSSCEPENQQKKAKLLYMQEEVCRRYKHYHQQMQMVASSFESVAGLSAAAPYVSVALKTVSRNFRCLRTAISDQLKHVAKVLGEDLLLKNAIASSSSGDTGTSRFRHMDQRQKYGGADAGFLEPQQHVFRPQRGLPERSVAILRAWLFDHFLHPYPTDTDKHMLASQTGLSRNQVSNWFINARVRVWKPMVEEIHMLETKGLAETNRNSVKKDTNFVDGTSRSTGNAEPMEEEQWNQERKSDEEFPVPTGMDGTLLNFLPFQRNAIDVGGLGAVSLTLGLRHGVENASQQQPQFEQHQDQLRRQFGGQMVHDFVG